MWCGWLAGWLTGSVHLYIFGVRESDCVHKHAFSLFAGWMATMTTTMFWFYLSLFFFIPLIFLHLSNTELLYSVYPYDSSHLIGTSACARLYAIIHSLPLFLTLLLVRCTLSCVFYSNFSDIVASICLHTMAMVYNR